MSPTASAGERDAALAVLATAAEREVGQPVKLMPGSLWRAGDYMVANVAIKRSDGGEINWESLPEFAPSFEAGAFDEYSEALLHKQDGTWRVVELRVGPTDTELEVWMEDYKLPPLVEMDW